MPLLYHSLLSEYTHYNVPYIAGCDEVGARAIAGPIIAAAVILPHDFYDKELYNVKNLTAASRIRISSLVKQQAIAWGIATVCQQDINKTGIANASQLAMHSAINQLKIPPDILLISGRSCNPYKDIPCKCVVHGDKIYAAVAAANIMAKVYRDSFMDKLDKDFPAYEWRKNKGYSTLVHKQAIKVFGITLHHRKRCHPHAD
ncbi:ribonuclease HII [Cardinium endosymbiont of Culicoides punctatus]|uniref:ribonuclease HII n=1 Tax=Cardinium endosymbiont of Culicoides punctatus TaxID=2304601 RepID=UPI001058547D|nr:ribonuclease HII [Cardinium endosymbiont of Culicoides punctatus]TDG95611.1 Ribonuclease HII [Cardinium endosymbiont of Culicoides punctatus]